MKRPGELRIKLSKSAADQLQAEADECGMPIELYAQMILERKKPRLLELTAEEKKELHKNLKAAQSMTVEILTRTN